MNLNNIIIEAEYADIILSLLNKPYHITSITKLIFIAFCVRHEQGNNFTYRNRTKDFVDVFFKNISVKLSSNYNDIKVILHFIDILKKNGNIVIDDDDITVINVNTHMTENDFLNFSSKQKINPIMEISKLDAKGLIEEVIRFV